MEQLALQAEITFAAGSQTVFLNGEDVTDAIRQPEVSAAASKVSAISGVRRALVDKQREMGASGSVVMEGRDIGSVVFPDARVKIFLDAPARERVERRKLELTGGSERRWSEDIGERDHRDRTRNGSAAGAGAGRDLRRFGRTHHRRSGRAGSENCP